MVDVETFIIWGSAQLCKSDVYK